MLAFRARYVFPIDCPPLRDGVVAIDHDRIIAVGESSSPTIRDFLPAARDLGDAAILPGFINPHTHLEFSDLRQPLGTPGMAFPEWIRAVVNHRRAFQDQPKRPVFESGVQESSRCGVTAVGEIASSPWHWLKLCIEVTQFHESLGLRAEWNQERWPKFTAQFEQMTRYAASKASGDWHLGISPHAPYTVHPELLQWCVRLSADRRVPLAHHLAESREELQLLRELSGPFVGILKHFDVWSDAIPFGSRPMDYLQMLAEAHRALVIHGNYLDDEEIGFLAQHADRMSVVYCPRTHAYFKHDPYPLAKMLAAGVNVAIGTDSRASNPDLSVLADMRFAARQHPVVPPAALLRMITTNAARALGRDAEIGTIAPGKFADLAILSLPPHAAADPHELLLDPACVVAAAIFRGRIVHGGDGLPAATEPK